jgi:hypothetical protein
VGLSVWAIGSGAYGDANQHTHEHADADSYVDPNAYLHLDIHAATYRSHGHA